MAGGTQFEQELPRAPSAPGQARQMLTRWYGTRLQGEELYRAKLLVSELVTNAVLHGKGRITLRSQLDAERLLVEVTDEGSGFEHDVRRRDFREVGGRGLSIVDSESSKWGIHEGTTNVWFELERMGGSSEAPEEAGPRLGEEQKPEG